MSAFEFRAVTFPLPRKSEKIWVLDAAELTTTWFIPNWHKVQTVCDTYDTSCQAAVKMYCEQNLALSKQIACYLDMTVTKSECIM